MVKIKKQMVGTVKNGYSGTNGRKYIAVHQTGNFAPSATAQMHANLQSNGFSASWAWQVDDLIAIQSFPHTAQPWHAGDSKGNGNLNSISVEICVNKTGKGYVKALENAAELIRKIMKDEGIPLSNVKQHNFFSGKNCPSEIRAGKEGITWSKFLKMIDGSSGSTTTTKPSQNSPKPTGNLGLVDYLNSKGMDSSIYNRKKLAAKYGIKNYKGTASQNTFLLTEIKGGKPSATTTSKPKTTGKARIRTIQSTLNSRYNTKLKVDGFDGPKTKKAIVKGYQTELNKQFNAGLVADGIWGAKTRGASVTVRRGAKGNLTWLIQARLYCLGYNPKGLDGIYGQGCFDAVYAFQKDKGIGKDGITGKGTFTKLFG